jgi:hypothetical protein
VKGRGRALALMGAFLGCAQLAGLSTHVSGDDGGAGPGSGSDGAAGTAGNAAGGAGAPTDGPVGAGSADAGPIADSAFLPVTPPPMCGGPDAAICPTGLGDCHGTGCNVSLTSDEDNCGVCGRGCRGGECQDGECLPVTIASGLHLTSHRQVAVSPAGVTFGTADGLIKRLPFQPGAQPITLAEGEGEVKDIVVDDEFAYVQVDGPHCQDGWCIRRIPLVPGKYPTTNLVGVGAYSSFMAIDDQAIYLLSHFSLIRVPTHAPGLPAVVELATFQGRPSTNVVIDGEFVYWGSNSDTEGIVKRIRKDGSDQAPQHLAAGLNEAAGVGVDERNVYWSAGSTGMVQTAPKQGGGPTVTLATDKGGPAVVMAVDEVNVYWGGDGGTSGFKKVPKCGGEPRFAAGGSSVFGIVPWLGNVYYSDSASGIFRVAQ